MTARSWLAVLVLSTGLAACSQEPSSTPDPGAPASSTVPRSPGDPDISSAPDPQLTPEPTVPQATQPETAPDPPAPGTVPPDWLGRRPLPTRPDGYGESQPTPPELDPRRFTLPDTTPELPGTGFASEVGAVPPDVLSRSTWEPGCPVRADELAYVRLTFWGFDDQRHTGELLVNASVAEDLVQVFRTLYRDRFPIEEMRITTRAELDARPTGDGNTTGAFVCRPTTGSTTTYSQHAYGLAIDVNPFQNPYEKGDLVLPELARSYLERTDDRPGMLTDEAVAAFARIGWEWGGDWQSLKDYQHFSQNGR